MVFIFFSCSNSIFKFYHGWWKNIDKTIFLIITLLFSLGLFFSLVSTSLVASDKLDTNNYFFFFKHLAYIIIGIFTLIFFSSLSQKNLFKISILFFFISVFLLILVPIIGAEVKGSKRWLDIFFLPRFQPIELVKPFTIILLASILSSEKNLNIYYKYFLSLIVIIPISLLLMMQPDIGQTLLIFLSWLTLIFISGISLIIFFSFFGISLTGLLCIVFFIPKFEYIKIRLISFLNPSSGNNYQSEKASEAIVNGSFFGKGIGEGELNTKIPEAHTDYIVSVISEEFGIVIIIGIMIIYLILALQILKKVENEKDNLIRLTLIGCMSILLIQAFIHLGVNIRMFPTTGMTLPFISYGGSSIIGTSMLCGIILNFTKRRINY